MGIFGKLAGGAIGMMFGGPLGAIAGAALGHMFDSNAGQSAVRCPHCNNPVNPFLEGNVICPHCKRSFQFSRSATTHAQAQLLFFVATFSLLAKLAKADGHISEEEIKTVDAFMKKQLKLDDESIATARKIFTEAKGSATSYTEFAQQFADLFRGNTEMKVIMLQILLQVAMADGHFHPSEETMIANIARIFGVPPSTYAQLKDSLVENKHKHYAVLGCAESDSMEVIKSKYRQLVKEYHPDKVAAKGLPDDFKLFAEKKFLEIQKAYEFIEKERKTNG